MKEKKWAGQILTYTLILCIFLGLAWWGSMATTAVAQLIPLERAYTVVIDPGHGGVDGGATSCTGVPESQLNLEIALKLNDLFQLLGYKTDMIRTTDVSVYTSGETIAAKKVSDLRQRVRQVNETENALLISIHQNTFSDSRYSGPQVFYGPEGQSEAFSKLLQETLTATVMPESNRSAKKGEGIYLLQNIKCTGALIECGFLSNLQEETKLRSNQYQQQLCCVISSVTANFLDGRSAD